jgi:formin-binding protein 1
VGDTPSLTPGSLESASLITWTTHLTTLESRAAEHEKLGQDLVNLVATPLENSQKKFEELRKSHSDYQTKLLKERDTSYGDLKKLKAKYDTVCQEVENKRKKSESAFDYNKSKAANSYNQQVMEMHNVKNTYLIGINVTNKLKECYYHEYVPELLDSLQDLSETRVAKLNSLWSQAASLESTTLQRSVDQMNHLSSEILRNNPRLDSTMFVRHNAVQWMDPPDMVFEPSPVWLDSDEMVVDDTSKIFLRNILSKSKPVGRQLKADLDQKEKELGSVRRARQAIREGKDKRDETDCVKSLFAVMEEMHAIERTRITAEVETSTIMAAAGDLSLRGRNHTFKSETFKIPTNCDLCGDRIWGLSAKGFSCTDCGFTCHSKCELKVPADCPGEQTKEEKKKLKAERQAAASAAVEPPATINGSSDGTALSRQNTMNTLSSGYAASAQRSVSGALPRSNTVTSVDDSSVPQNPTTPPAADTSKPKPAPGARRNRIVAPPPTAYVTPQAVEQTSNGGGLPRGVMLYPYEARDAGEVSVAEGKEVIILEPDGKLKYSLREKHLLNVEPRWRLDQDSRWFRLRRPGSNNIY